MLQLFICCLVHINFQRFEIYDVSLYFSATDSSFSVLPGISGLNSTNITGGSSFDNSSAIPTIVRCDVNKPCHIPVIIHGGASQL